MAVVGRSTISPLTNVDLHDVYMETGKERPREYSMFMNVREMESNPIKDQQVAAIGSMPQKPEGQRFTLDQPIMGGTQTTSATAYGLAIEFTWEGWRDENYGTLREFVREMARAGRFREETDAHGPINHAFDTTFVGFDGLQLCSTAHTRMDGGANQTNRPSPDVGLSITYVQGAVLRFHKLLNERGFPWLMAPVMALVAADNVFVAREIFGSGGRPYSGDNELNSLVEEDLSFMVDHYITTVTNVFLLAAKGVHDLNFYWRDHPMFDSFDDPWTKNAIHTAYQRHAVSFGSFKGVDGSTG